MPKEFKVWCETKDELNEVLTRAGRDGYTWASGNSPLDYPANIVRLPIGIIGFKACIYFAQSRLDFEDFFTSNMTEFTVQEYVKNGCPVDTLDLDKIVLKRGGLVEALKRVIESDNNLRELLTDAPLIVTFTAILVGKLEEELFDK